MAVSTRPSLPRARIFAVTAAAAAVLAVAAVQLLQDSALSLSAASSTHGPARTAPVPEPPTGTATTGGLTSGTRRAYRAAAAAMHADGIEITLSSGYRSPAEQEQLYQEAIAKYGSPEAARIWVLPPDESHHVRGIALDVAPREAAQWLDRHGVRYGLCRTMDWEWWHFEYGATWQRAGLCPPPRRRP
jgi:D-alanyl-D-alanine carboxypeptidase